ncbi:hypothetical protein T459_15104 [Capsicum annuum]|uniref:Uncharacterized protein n=1 Tax=Capsicum annuum TaxID=4072 RepID=A0A2G2ZJA9_CAPAN|nr:hypothetical protein T459_15104 [Capsicum annuum]
MMSPPSSPTLSPDGDQEDGPAADSENSTAGKKKNDEEIEMEDTEDWSVVDIDSSDKKNKLTVVEYIDDIYAYYKKAEYPGSRIRRTRERERHALPVVVLNEIVDVCTTYVAPGSGEGGKVFLSSFALREPCVYMLELYANSGMEDIENDDERDEEGDGGAIDDE